MENNEQDLEDLKTSNDEICPYCQGDGAERCLWPGGSLFCSICGGSGKRHEVE